MAPETTATQASPQQNPWTVAGSAVGSSIGGSAEAVGSALMPWVGPGGAAAGSATPGGGAPRSNPSHPMGEAYAEGAAPASKAPERSINPDKDSQPAVKEAVVSAMGTAGKGPAEPQEAVLSPAKLDEQFKSGKGADVERARALGMTADQYKQQYVHEYMARLSQTDPFQKGPDGKPLLGKDGKPVSNYSPAQQNSLTAWGYNAQVDPNNVVDDNKQTGLFAVRFEPSAAGAKAGRAPVVAFRGTEPDRGVVDLGTDTRDKYIGRSQYEPNKERIAGLFGRTPGEKADVVGYSLGGALAQRSLVDNADHVRALTTFQSPGIQGSDAAKVNAAAERNGIDVNHHFFTNDVVHRAGEAKVNGNYHEYTRSGWLPGVNSLDAHLSSFMIPSDGAKGTRDGHGNEKKEDGYQCATNNADGHSTQIQNYQNDRQGFDRRFWETERRMAGPSIARLLDTKKAAGDLWQKTDAEGNPELGPDNKPVAGPLQAATKQVGAGWDGVRQGGKEIVAGGSSIGSGVSDLFHGRFRQGLSEIGNGVVGGGKGLVDAAVGGGNMWSGATKAAGTVGNFLATRVLPGALDLGMVLSQAPGILTYMAGSGAVNLTKRAATAVGNTVSNGYNAAVDWTKGAAQTVGNTVSNGYNAAVDWTKGAAQTVGNGFNSAVDYTKGAAQTVGNTISNGYNATVDYAKGAAQTVGNGFNSAVDYTKGAARTIGNGISNGFGWMADKAKSFWPFSKKEEKKEDKKEEKAH